jgi:hypothetical protein
MRKAGSISRSNEPFPGIWAKINSIVTTQNLLVQMVQNSIIGLINYCSGTCISLEPLIKGTGQGGVNFLTSLFRYFLRRIHHEDDFKGHIKESEKSEKGSEKILLQIVKDLYGNTKMDESLFHHCGITFDIRGQNVFSSAATDIDAALSKMVTGKITQQEENIRKASPQDPILTRSRKETIERLKSAPKISQFQRFLELYELAPPHLKPKIAPLSPPTHSYAHITEETLFQSLASKRGKTLYLNVQGREFTHATINENPGELIDALFNANPLGATLENGSRAWKTRSRKASLKFIYTRDASERREHGM